MSNTKKLTTSAILVALSVVLVLFSKLIPAPWLQGGSVTIASMVPIIIISLLFGTKWGLISGFVFSVIQMMTGFYAPPARTFTSFFLAIFLDYIAAFSVLGTANLFFSLFKKKIYSISLAGFIVTVIRYICHIIAGVLVWNVYAGENQSVLVYSIVYNGSYMIPEIIITTITLAILSKFLYKKIQLN